LTDLRTLDEELFREPCNGEITETEILRPHGVRSLILNCSCGKMIGSHLLQDESEIKYPHCQSVITREDALAGLSELLMCHRKGLTFDAYMGYRLDGTEMTDEEYIIVRERIES
jgi:hypothetical protein